MMSQTTHDEQRSSGPTPSPVIWIIEDRADIAYVPRLMVEVSFPDVRVREFRNGILALAALKSESELPIIITVDGDLGKNQKLGPQVIEELGPQLGARKATVWFAAMSGVDELNEAMRAAAEKIGQPIEILGKGPEANAKLLALIEKVQKGEA